MEYLFDCIDGLKRDLGIMYIALFLDYDGTLTPIVESPKKAILSEENMLLLKGLAGLSMCRLAIISGRALSDIKGMVGVDGITYAGNHGLEVEGPGIKLQGLRTDDLVSIIRETKRDLSERLSGLKGILIEDKGLTLSVHYRMASVEDSLLVTCIVHDVARPYVEDNKIMLNMGKAVIEIRPAIKWDKGSVVLWLLSRSQFAPDHESTLPVYIGDDMTDEDAFEVLRGTDKGLTIFVGSDKKSHARYYLKDTEDVTRFLRMMLDLRKDDIKNGLYNKTSTMGGR